MKKNRYFLMSALVTGSLLLSQVGLAKVWRLNNTPGVAANFSTLPTAVAAAATGDTIHVEGSSTTYSGTVNKKLVFIGTGYFLSGSGANIGLQANPNPSTVSFSIDSAASGSQFIGLSGSFSPSGGADNVVMNRCNIISLGTFSPGTYNGWMVSQCYFESSGITMNQAISNWQITNNIFDGSNFVASTASNTLIRNNTFRNVTVNASNAYIANNIFLGNQSRLQNVVNSTIKYNMAAGNILPTGDNNQNNVAQASIIVGSGSEDGYYQLATNSPAIGAGEPINGVVPDLGAFGTAVPYRLSGIPPIPTIYVLTVPPTVPANSTTITISLSTRSNN